MRAILKSILILAMFCVGAMVPVQRAFAVEDDDADFADGNGREVLLHVANRLSSQIQLLPEGVFPVVPSDWNRDRMAKALDKIHMMPDDHRMRAHRSLMFDHDVKKQEIVALQPFFVMYGLVPSGKDLSRDQLRDLERKLLQEMAGLWKASPKDSEKFAEAVITLFDRDIVFCKGEVKMSSAIEYHFVVNPSWMEGGVLVTSPTWAISPDAQSYKEMQGHGVNSELYKSFISRGLGDNGVVSIEHLTAPQAMMKINFKVTKINYLTETGKGEFIDIDAKTHPIECHNLLLDDEVAKQKVAVLGRAPQTQVPPAAGSAKTSPVVEPPKKTAPTEDAVDRQVTPKVGPKNPV